MRRKKVALPVPTSTEQATRLLVDYVRIERSILELRLSTETKIDALKASRDSIISNLQVQQSQSFLSLKAWREAVGHELAKRSRSTELAGAKIGIRLAPPKVKFSRGVSARGIANWLRTLRWSRAKEFLRVKAELDKQALIKAHQDDEAVRRMFAAAGVGVVQDDEFFIDAQLDEESIRDAIAAEVAE